MAPGPARRQVHHHHVFLEAFGPREQAALASNAPLRPSKIRSSLPPTWFTKTTGRPYFPSQVAEHLFAQKLLPHGERRRREVDDRLGPRLCQHLDGVLVIAPALPEIAVVPDVFADADA
jgi:hypothetical protein